VGTESPLRDLMIEIVSDELVSFDVIRIAGELIAAEATFSARMMDLQGRSNPRVYLGGLKLGYDLIDEARNAWDAFKAASAGSAWPSSEVQQALVAALSRVQAALQQYPESNAS
jgi:hypothetical protein